jgi:hypothetical protein
VFDSIKWLKNSKSPLLLTISNKDKVAPLTIYQYNYLNVCHKKTRTKQIQEREGGIERERERDKERERERERGKWEIGKINCQSFFPVH